MKTSINGLDFLAKEEGLRLKSYQDIVGIWTIGIGNTRYEDGTPVGPNEVITKERAIELFKNTLARFEATVSMATKGLNQNQFDACVSLCYNIGEAAFRISTLRGIILGDPNNRAKIEPAWLKWNRAGGKVSKGLAARRKREVEFYFTPL